MTSFSASWFFNLESQIREMGADSDAQSFDEIRENLARPRKMSPDEFADMCNYVILAGGFSQRTAKKIHAKISEYLHAFGTNKDALLEMFNNKNKINAICKIWNTRHALCAEYYGIDDFDNKIKFLEKLPHIGKITANHLARNLGLDIVKYDIWIQRLGVVFCGNKKLEQCINNGKLNPDVKAACDEMFAHLVRETGLPRGYIDVVLWKGLQIGLIKI